MEKKKTVEDIDVFGRKVMVRVDYNVPLEPVFPSKVTDDIRIRETLPTIAFLREKGAKEIILVSHLGRPDGKVVDSLKMKPVAEKLVELLKLTSSSEEIKIGKFPAYRIADDIVLLENIRFWPEEERNDENFAKSLAELAEVYVNDAFGSAHRAHASVVGVAKFLPAVAGLLMAKELETLSELLIEPTRPYVAIQGGIKITDKLHLLLRLIDLVDYILVGSGLAATFYKAQGFEVGKSKTEEKAIGEALQVLEKSKLTGENLVLPVDFVVADASSPEARKMTVEVPKEKGIICNEPWLILDIGPKTIEMYIDKIVRAKTIFWNGPLGLVEIPDFSVGSRKIAEAIGKSGAKSVLGGGDIVAFVHRNNLQSNFSYISTGGGAALDFIAGRSLPGVEVLQDK